MLRDKKPVSANFPFYPLSANSLFHDLPLHTLQSFDLIKKPRRLGNGEIVYSQGRLACCIYILIRGEALQILNPELAGVAVSRRVDQNEICGLSETVSAIPYQMTVAATSPCLFEVIRKDDLRRFLQDESAVSFRLLKLLAANLQKSYQMLSSSTS